MSEAPWHGKNVLIVDDSLVAREQLQGLYRDLGLVVVGTAVNGVEALEFLEQKTPDLVSLDINMPEMDGVECYQILTERNPGIKVAMISWLASDPRLVESLAEIVPEQILGAKPIDLANLKALLARVYGLVQYEERLNLEDKETLGGPSHQMPTYTHKVG